MNNKNSILKPVSKDNIPEKYKRVHFDRRSNWLYLKISTAIFLVLFLLGFFFDKNSIYLIFWIAFVLLVYVFSSLVLSDAIGRKKHYTFLNSQIGKRFQDEFNFKVEHLNGGRYHGLIGEYEGYIIRIYYNWVTLITSRNVNREVCFHIYYSPGDIAANEWEKKLQDLNGGAIYEPNYEGLRRYSINHAELHRKYNFFSTYEHYKKALDHFIAFLKEQDLNPLEMKYVIEINEDEPYINMPSIDTLLFDED